MTVMVVTPSDAISRDEEFCDWLREQGIEPTDTYRLEITDSKATVFQYDADEEGSKFAVCEQCDEPVSGTLHRHVCSGKTVLAKREPFEVAISGPIPGTEVVI